MKRKSILYIVIMQFAFSLIFAQSNGVNFPATDNLGRKLPTYKDVGASKQDKTVAMFFWTWHSGHSQNSKAYDLSKIIEGHPEMINDYDHPLWGPYEDGNAFFWGEPVFDYYDGMDKWVIRKQLEMIADAGVDVLFYDATNIDEVWKEGYEAVGDVMTEMRASGLEVPQFAFMLNFGPLATAASAIGRLYDNVYSVNEYKDSWFMWKGKPAIMAYPESLNEVGDSDVAALRFTSDSEFSGVSASCPSWGNNIGNLTLSIYNWVGTYSASVAETPLAKKEFVNYIDNAYLTLEFGALPAGDYIWVLSDAVETVGVWKYVEESIGVDSYLNGQLVLGDYNSKIRYTSNNQFVDLTTGSQLTHEAVMMAEGMDPETKSKIRDFFTFRPGQPAMNAGSAPSDDYWGWLEIFPQHGYKYDSEQGNYELVTVGVAQNWSDSDGGLTAMNAGPSVRGRSFTSTDQFSKLDEESYKYGYNFQEQWDRALDIDPQIIFITGWNEWVAGRFRQWPDELAHNSIPQVGSPVDNAFPDQFSPEYSRDIEPMKGGHGDNYYYQMIANIRKYKGMEKPQTVSEEQTISIDGSFEEWVTVTPDFKASIGDAGHRDGYGYIDPESTTRQPLHYTNTTGRNDIVGAKCARDENYIYFYVETATDITASTDANWMCLFIDSDRNKETGWEGYDYVINRVSPEADKAILESTVKNWADYSEADRVDFNVIGNKMEMAVPIRLFREGINFEFKWSDNSLSDGDIMNLLVNGDVAPSGRFNYAYLPTEELALEDLGNTKNSLKVMPNPFNNDIELSFDMDKHYIKDSKVELFIYNSLGQIIDAKLLGEASFSRIKYNTQHFEKGVYFISVQVDGRKVETVKVVKNQTPI